MKYSMFFGQNAVDPNSPDYQGWSGILNGCVPDATDLAIATSTMGYTAKALFSGWNVAGKSVPWVMSSQCTVAAWRDVHEDLQARVRPGDCVILGNSGHGGQYNTPTAANGGETLCFYDGLLYDSEQHEMMKAWPAGVNVLYVLDSCHSGGLDRSTLCAAIRAAPPFITPATVKAFAFRSPSDISANIVQFCACRATEVAQDGPQNGAFTGSLLAVWDQARVAGVALTFQSWIDATVTLMVRCFPAQHPVVNVLGGGGVLLRMAV